MKVITNMMFKLIWGGITILLVLTLIILEKVTNIPFVSNGFFYFPIFICYIIVSGYFAIKNIIKNENIEQGIEFRVFKNKDRDK